MKRVLILLLSAVLMTAALTGCSSGEEDALVSKTPFPEFSEVDIAGDEISSDIFADYDATIVNFWKMAAVPASPRCLNWRSCIRISKSETSTSSVWVPTPARAGSSWTRPGRF